jgi:non-homologous end joining protein Ku
MASRRWFLPERNRRQIIHSHPLDARSGHALRKLIAFDDDTLDKLTQLARDRMATFQELADEAFADLLKKHGIPIDLKDALRKSARLSKDATPKKTRSRTARMPS